MSNGEDLVRSSMLRITRRIENLFTGIDAISEIESSSQSSMTMCGNLQLPSRFVSSILDETKATVPE